MLLAAGASPGATCDAKPFTLAKPSPAPTALPPEDRPKPKVSQAKPLPKPAKKRTKAIADCKASAAKKS